jgi:hypothetical protein
MRWKTAFRTWFTSIEPSSRREIWAAIVFAVVLGAPYIDTLGSRMTEQTYRDEERCQRDKKLCWIKVKYE